jgi:translation elongation factor EF-Tu-like GTPase
MTKKKVKKTAVKAKKKPPAKKKASAKSSKKKIVSKKIKAKAKSKKEIATKVQPVLGKEVGIVTHYFSQVNAAVVKIKKGSLKLGDQLYFKGHTTDLKSTIESLQIDRKPIPQAEAGDEIGVGVNDKVRVGDQVFKI